MHCWKLLALALLACEVTCQSVTGRRSSRSFGRASRRQADELSSDYYQEKEVTSLNGGDPQDNGYNGNEQARLNDRGSDEGSNNGDLGDGALDDEGSDSPSGGNGSLDGDGNFSDDPSLDGPISPTTTSSGSSSSSSSSSDGAGSNSVDGDSASDTPSSVNDEGGAAAGGVAPLPSPTAPNGPRTTGSSSNGSGSSSSSSSGDGSDEDAEKDPNDLTWLRNAIRGEPDRDYPILSEVPNTSFKCSERDRPGYYGDPEARCQVFHICQDPDNSRMDSFLCPNGTIFSQQHFVCVWWWQYDCAQTEKDWSLNANLWNDDSNNQAAPLLNGDDGGDGSSNGGDSALDIGNSNGNNNNNGNNNEDLNSFVEDGNNQDEDSPQSLSSGFGSGSGSGSGSNGGDDSDGEGPSSYSTSSSSSSGDGFGDSFSQPSFSSSSSPSFFGDEDVASPFSQQNKLQSTQQPPFEPQAQQQVKEDLEGNQVQEREPQDEGVDDPTLRSQVDYSQDSQQNDSTLGTTPSSLPPVSASYTPSGDGFGSIKGSPFSQSSQQIATNDATFSAPGEGPDSGFEGPSSSDSPSSSSSPSSDNDIDQPLDSNVADGGSDNGLDSTPDDQGFAGSDIPSDPDSGSLPSNGYTKTSVGPSASAKAGGRFNGSVRSSGRRVRVRSNVRRSRVVTRSRSPRPVARRRQPGSSVGAAVSVSVTRSGDRSSSPVSAARTLVRRRPKATRTRGVVRTRSRGPRPAVRRVQSQSRRPAQRRGAGRRSFRKRNRQGVRSRSSRV